MRNSITIKSLGLCLAFTAFNPDLWASEDLTLEALCSTSTVNDSLDRPIIVIDAGFCAEYKIAKDEQATEELLNSIHGKPVTPLFGDKKGLQFKLPDRWKLRLYTSHTFTTYFNTDIHLTSSRYNVDIKDYEWVERGSREYFEPQTWKIPGNNPFQVIDEPTNTFAVSIEKDGHEFFLSAFHAKYLQNPKQVKYIKGNIDGVDVDGVMEVNRQFDGNWNEIPGESKLAGNKSTYREMQFEIGYGHRIKVLDSKFGSIVYVPAIAIGVMAGQTETQVVEKGKWFDRQQYDDGKYVQGFGGSLTNRIEINSPKERFGLFYENRLSYYKQEHGFLDGTQRYDLKLMGNSIGMKMMIYNPNNHKRKKKPLFNYGY